MSARAQSRSPTRSSPGEKIRLGRIGAARGLKGEVRIRAFTRRARDIAAYGPLTDAAGLRSFAVTIVSETGDGVVARLSGIADRTAAERLKGLELFVARAALPELPAGEFYWSDLLGLAAEDQGGRPLGRVARIDDFGAGAILEIEGGALWPAAMIAAVDLDAGKLVLAAREEFAVDPQGGGTGPRNP